MASASCCCCASSAVAAAAPAASTQWQRLPHPRQPPLLLLALLLLALLLLQRFGRGTNCMLLVGTNCGKKCSLLRLQKLLESSGMYVYQDMESGSSTEVHVPKQLNC